MPTPDPNPEKLNAFYHWLYDQIQMSHDHFTPGGQKVGHVFWMHPSARIMIERQLRDMEVLPDGYDFPWTYCEKCGQHYTASRYDLEGKKVCGTCWTEAKYGC